MSSSRPHGAAPPDALDQVFSVRKLPLARVASGLAVTAGCCSPSRAVGKHVVAVANYS